MPDSGALKADRVVVGVSGSPGSLTALHRAADEARCRGARLWIVRAWEPPGGELSHRRSPVPADLLEHCRRLAGQELITVVETVFGPHGPGVPLHASLARGRAAPALVEVADRATDVLVVGAGRRGRLHRALTPSVTRYCLAHAGCPVLAVPPSPLESELAAVHRRNTWRLRLDAHELTGEPRP
ncbi:universal stress protein [Actinomycetota bacterium Odt1-20B]